VVFVLCSVYVLYYLYWFLYRLCMHWFISALSSSKIVSTPHMESTSFPHLSQCWLYLWLCEETWVLNCIIGTCILRDRENF
jgi:hypothetical protein